MWVAGEGKCPVGKYLIVRGRLVQAHTGCTLVVTACQVYVVGSCSWCISIRSRRLIRMPGMPRMPSIGGISV